MEGIIIVGDGIAANNAIKAIREIDKDISIHLFGNEKFYPYNRIKLSKGLFDRFDEDGILLQKKDWYELNNINLHLNTKVVGIDIEHQEVFLSDDGKLKYDKLLIASGGSNIVPSIEGISKEKVYSLRTLEDAQQIQDKIEETTTVLNIGGGIQGLETAWILRQHNKDVIIAEIQSRLMPRQLDEEGSRILQEAVEKAGVKILLNTEVDKIIGEQQVQSVQTKSGETVPCDMVSYCVGIKPNIDFLVETPIKTNRGVIVDERMMTNIENIYAAGDVAEFDGRLSGLWNIAIGQGKVAGYNLVENPSIYSKIVPVTTLNAYGISLFSMGNVEESVNTKTIVDKDNSKMSYKKIFIEDNRIVGAIVIGDITKSPLLKTAIEKRMSLEGMDYMNISLDEIFINLKNNKS